MPEECSGGVLDVAGEFIFSQLFLYSWCLDCSYLLLRSDVTIGLDTSLLLDDNCSS